MAYSFWDSFAAEHPYLQNVADYGNSNGIPYGMGGKTPDAGKGFFDEYLNGLGDYIKQNPIAPFSAVGSLWNTWNNYNNNKKALALARDNYNLQKQAYLDNEARNKEAFNWQRQQRLSAQL